MSSRTRRRIGLTLLSCLVIPIAEWTGLLAIAGMLHDSWWWLLGLMLVGAVVAALAWCIRFSAGQVLLVIVPAALVGGLALFAVPWGWLAWSFGLTVFAMVCGSAASTCHNRSVHRTGSIIGIQALWLAPFTASIYAYSYIGPNASALPFTGAVILVIFAIFIADF